MLRKVNINDELQREKKRTSSEADTLVYEAQKILRNQLFTEKNILNNLKSYHKTFGLAEEDGLDKSSIYTLNEIRAICVRHRLRFLDSDKYSGEFPYESVLKIKDLNTLQRKDLCYFKVLTSDERFTARNSDHEALLLAETVYGNYYVIHRWGKPIEASRKWKYLPLRNFETLVLTILLISGLLTLLTPNKLLTTDTRADYFSMYRVACFFHVLILFSGFTVFYLFKRNISFSSACWDSPKFSN